MLLSLLCILFLKQFFQNPTAIAVAQVVDSTETVTSTALDVTNEVELLGNPSSIKYSSSGMTYARNVWDLQLFDNKIYIGQGNSSNAAPAANAGPAEVWYFDIASAQFVKQFTTNEEQVDKFRVLGNQLAIPGHDPRESWTLGNYYKLENNTWKKYRNIANAIHTYDLYKFNNKIYSALGSSTYNSFHESSDGGLRWKQMKGSLMRAYTYFELGGKLYSSGQGYKEINQFNGTTFVVPTHNFLLGGTSLQGTKTPPLVVRPQNFQNQLVYVLAKNVNDHQWTPLQLNVAASATNVRKATLPGSAMPWDIICKTDKCYALGAIYQGPGKYLITVSQSTNLNTWSELFRFKSDTFARSFELDANGNFYFGLGSETSSVSASTGNILRVAKSAWMK